MANSRSVTDADGKLTARAEQFCREYIIDFNGAQAAIRAGVPEKGAKVRASEMLTKPEVQARISELMAERAKRTGVTADRVIQELATVGFSRVTDYMRIGKDGEPAVDLSNLTDDQKAAIAEVVVEDFTDGRGDDARDVRRVRFKLHNKIEALDKLGKHLGIFEKDNQQRGLVVAEDIIRALDERDERAKRNGGGDRSTDGSGGARGA